jgi:hypothetical protein
VGERGSYVKDIAAASYGFGPSVVCAEVGGHEGESGRPRCARGFECSADLGFAGERANGGAHVVSGAEQLIDAVGSYEAGASGDKNEVFTHEREYT